MLEWSSPRFYCWTIIISYLYQSFVSNVSKAFSTVMFAGDIWALIKIITFEYKTLLLLVAVKKSLVDESWKKIIVRVNRKINTSIGIIRRVTLFVTTNCLFTTVEFIPTFHIVI